MNMFSIFALMLAPSPPVPINEAQMRDIGCVATIGIIAHEQRLGAGALASYADVRESGKRWAGIVGQRVMDETGQPREVVAFAIKQAVEAEQAKVIGMDDGAKSKDYVRNRFAECKSVMDAQLATADASTPATAVGNSASMLAGEPAQSTDEPDKIALYRTQLGEDLGNPHRIRYCKTLVDISYNEISGREGADSRDAKAFSRLVQAFAFKAQGLPAAEKPKPISADELQAELEKEPSSEEKMARCLRLGESLALAMPPE
ncbi:hypothetical protein [Sphingorhabdus sp.]|uniref:hypothetical protein n=1 Tax=Sphingorhabdus sp. TaxID=1902408 RepID=UPI0032B78D52